MIGSCCERWRVAAEDLESSIAHGVCSREKTDIRRLFLLNSIKNNSIINNLCTTKSNLRGYLFLPSLFNMSTATPHAEEREDLQKHSHLPIYYSNHHSA